MKFITILFALFAILAIYSSSVSAQSDCSTCELVINFIEEYAENNSSEEVILQALDSLCALFPSYASTCDAIAAQGLSQVIAWINQNETPQTICTQLGLCSTQSSTQPTKVTLPKFSDLKKFKLPSKTYSRPAHSTHRIGDAECAACEEVISTIEMWLDQTDNEDDVISAVEIVCTYMPDWDATCDAIVEAEVPQVVEWIEKYENSTIVCNQLSMCPSSNGLVRVTDNCGECQNIVATIENWVASSATEQQVETYLDVACTLVPQWTSICDNVIAQSVPQIVSWAEAQETPQDICTQLNVC